jgi:hypothetical protein
LTNEAHRNAAPHERAADAAPRASAARTALRPIVRPLLALSLAFAVSLAAGGGAYAQQKFSKTYRAQRPTVRLELANRSGTIEVEGWEKPEIKVSADMESPSAHFTPVVREDGVVIDVVNDTRGKENVGDVNFRVRVPFDSEVTVRTKVGNISVSGVRGSMVFAFTSKGDIDLTNLRAFKVIASNITGNIFFDAELLRGGSYDLKSTSGDINVRVTGGSGFTLTAMAPRTRNISLGPFASMGTFDFSDNRQVHGRVGDGSAILMPTSLRGSIVFVSR